MTDLVAFFPCYAKLNAVGSPSQAKALEALYCEAQISSQVVSILGDINMSGAEALVAVGIASNVAQFIDFGSRLCSRIKGYTSSATGAPEFIATLAARLDLVLKTLNALNDGGRSTIDHEAKTIQSCISEVKALDALLDTFKIKTRVIPDGEDGPSWDDRKLLGVKIWKAFKLVPGEEKIDKFQQSLNRLLSLVSLQLQSRTAGASEQTLNELRILMKSMQLDHGITSEKSKPIILIPYSRNPEFIGRSDIFQQLDHEISQSAGSQQRAILYGLGGVGKSQIALEYAFRVKERLPEYSIFWVYASNVARFEEAYERIADECDIPSREDPKSDLMQLVRNWLETRIKMPWLMIIDNVDSPKEFYRKTNTGKSISEYVPKTLNGHILYTTRNRDVACDIARDPISVARMTHEEAGILLDIKTGRKTTPEEKAGLLEELDYLPLAISQAAAFMAKRHKMVPQYLTLYRHSNSTRIKLLSHEFADHGRETRGLESVVTTWMISFEYIREENQRAAEMLSLMSFFDRQGIPESLIHVEDEDPVAFIDAIGMLEAFSLVTVNELNNSYNVHRLVQVATRIWLTKYEESRGTKWESRALSLISKQFPWSEYSTLKLCAAYLPHVEAVLHCNFDDKAQGDLLNRASLLEEVANYFNHTAAYDAAKKMAQESFRIRGKFLGLDNLDALSSMELLASILRNQGELAEAEAMYQWALAGREKALGPEDKLTLGTVNNLGILYNDQGKLADAETMYQRALVGREKVLGPYHPSTLGTVNNLGTLYNDQGKLADAKAMYQRALVGREKALGLEHRSTLGTVNNMGILYKDQGKLAKAEAMFQRALVGSEKLMGPDHPSTLSTVNNLGILYSDQEKPADAEAMYQRALVGSEKALGPEHRSTLSTINNLGTLYKNQGKPAEAEAMFQRALAGREKVLGPDHPSTLSTVINLGTLYNDQGKLTEAEAMFKRALVGREQELGPGHPLGLGTVNSPGLLHKDHGRPAEAEAMYQRVLAGCEKTPGSNHMSALRTANSLSLLYNHQGKLAKAEAIFQRCSGR